MLESAPSKRVTAKKLCKKLLAKASEKENIDNGEAKLLQNNMRVDKSNGGRSASV